MTEDVAIIDYGMGNINSIKNMLRYLGYGSKLTNQPNEILSARKLILPGVGNYKKAMEQIRMLELDKQIVKAVKEVGTPLLGICLGMQLLVDYSEEGDCEGLGLIKGGVYKFDLDTSLYKIPHMGWDYISIKNKSGLVYGLSEDSRFYFVHSYYVKCNNKEHCIATTNYGIEFDSIIQKDNVFGTQFHPEKSHKFGMRIIKNFLEQ